MAKKINPYRRPMSQADLIRAKKDATKIAVEHAWSIFFMVLRDKEGYTIDDLVRVWNEIEDLSDSINRGYCTVTDLKHILKEEAGAVIKGEVKL